MALTALDVGVFRFLEFSATLLFQQAYPEEDLHDAAWVLLSKWPVLGSRLNLLRTDLQQSAQSKGGDIWTGRRIDKNVDDFIDLSSQEHSDRNTKELDCLFDFANGMRRTLHGQVLHVKTLSFRDATAIRFLVQHPLCDAFGGYTIAQAYCNILSGKEVPDISFQRSPLKLQDGVTEAAFDKGALETPPLVEQGRELYDWSWRKVLNSCVKLLAQAILHPSLKRVDQTLYISAKQIDIWKQAAQKQEINVTEHDLIAAFIYQSVYDKSVAQDFITVLGIRRSLQNQTPIHNSCILLPINLGTLHEKHPNPTHPEIAAEIRRTICEARHPAVTSGVLDLYARSSSTFSPMVPRWLARKQPQASITSWTDLPFFELNARGTKPSLVSAEGDFPLYLKRLGIVFGDILTTLRGGSDGKSGYLVRGKLPRETWEKIRDGLDVK